MIGIRFWKKNKRIFLRMHLICIGAHFKMFSIWITTYIARDRDRSSTRKPQQILQLYTFLNSVISGLDMMNKRLLSSLVISIGAILTANCFDHVAVTKYYSVLSLLLPWMSYRPIVCWCSRAFGSIGTTN